MESDEAKFRADVQKYLIESGENDRLVNMMRDKLYNSEWKDNVVRCCKDVIYEVGVDNVTLDTLIERVTPKAKEIVPADIKHEMFFKIKSTIDSKFNVR